MEQFAPTSAHEVAEIVQAAVANEAPIEVAGNLTKQALGRPVEAERILSTRNMRGVHFYEPSELVVSTGPGTTMRELTDLLDQHGQELAFEPMDYGHLYRNEALAGTIGGAVAVNASGSRRIKAGAARDHVLGFSAISGRGEAFQSGGRVMKNVTGYDLSKLMTGSYGTLGVYTELTLKVLPKPEMEETLVIVGLSDQAAVDIMTQAAGLPHEVSSFTHLPGGVADKLDEPFKTASAMTALRLEGPEISVAKRKKDLQDHFSGSSTELYTITTSHSRGFWRNVRDCQPIAGGGADIWRISTSPTQGAQVVMAIQSAGIDVVHYYDWSGGLIWLATTTDAAIAASGIRAALTPSGGHATLVRASAASRSAVDVFHPQPTALSALTARIKQSFDPERVLNRGRMRQDL